MNQKPIPNFLAKVTDRRLAEEIIKDNQAIKIALSGFASYRKPGCTLKLTISKATEEVIKFNGNLLNYSWDKQSIVGQIFTLSDKKDQSKILNSTRKFKINKKTNEINLVRDLLCYDGTAYETDEKASAILVVCAIKNGEQLDIVATLYKIDSGWLEKYLEQMDLSFYFTCHDFRDDIAYNRIEENPTLHDISVIAERRRHL